MSHNDGAAVGPREAIWFVYLPWGRRVFKTSRSASFERLPPMNGLDLWGRVGGGRTILSRSENVLDNCSILLPPCFPIDFSLTSYVKN